MEVNGILKLDQITGTQMILNVVVGGGRNNLKTWIPNVSLASSRYVHQRKSTDAIVCVKLTL